MLILIAYYRVSTDRQGVRGLGMEAQRTAVESYAARIGATIVASYVEVESGRNCSRPQLKAALADAKARGAKLIVAKLDRLARDARFVLELCDGGVPLMFLDLPDLPASDPIVGRLILTVMAAVAEFEARRIGQRVREALARYKARGGKLGRQDPRCRGRATPPPELQREYARIGRAKLAAARTVYLERVRPIAVQLRAAGSTLAAIAAELTARGISTPRNRTWTPGLVRHLLTPETGGSDVSAG